MARRIIGGGGFQSSLIGRIRRVASAALPCGLLAMGLSLSACSARYILSDSVLADAHRANAVEELYPLVSNRTIITYDRREEGQTQLGRTVRNRSQGRQLIRVLNRNRQGIIVEEAMLNGAPLLWVSFEPAKCREAACAIGFVRTDDGRYRLASLPERDGFELPKVYRGIVSKRQQMKLGKLKSLADANSVYGLERKRKRHRTVFLELKKEIKKRTIKDKEDLGGR